jgi:hypothetical protein
MADAVDLAPDAYPIEDVMTGEQRCPNVVEVTSRTNAAARSGGDTFDAVVSPDTHEQMADAVLF